MEIQWELTAFTLLVCLAAGAFGAAALFAAFGRGARVQAPLLAVSAGALIAGGVASFVHLEHWERIFNGFGNPTSGITQELIAIVAFACVLAAYAVVLRRRTAGGVPRALAFVAAAVAAALVIVMANSYLMAARPAWATPLLMLYYLSQAALLGTLCAWGLAAWRRDAAGAPYRTAALIAAVAAALATAAYVAYLAATGPALPGPGLYFDPTSPTSGAQTAPEVFAGVLWGAGAPLVWGGALVLGALVPLALSFAGKGRAEAGQAALGGVAVASVLAGGLCFRAALYLLGASAFMAF